MLTAAGVTVVVPSSVLAVDQKHMPGIGTRKNVIPSASSVIIKYKNLTYLDRKWTPKVDFYDANGNKRTIEKSEINVEGHEEVSETIDYPNDFTPIEYENQSTDRPAP